MTDIEMLPSRLPRGDVVVILRKDGSEGVTRVLTDSQVDDYARAVAEHNVKLATAELHRQFGCELRDPNGTIWDHAVKLQAEIERLRAEVEEASFSLSCLQQQYDDRTAYTIIHRGAMLACSSAMRDAYSDAIARAERAEAEAAKLRLLCQSVHDRLLRGDDDAELLAMLEAGYASRNDGGEDERG